MKVVWQWIAFSLKGVARPVYHATRAARPGLVHEPRWDRACEGKGGETALDPEGREWCIACQRAVMAG